ncbi:hypothetical protein FBUS_00034 [Fasciolopsis buskii]|uniref:Uncharacterized protein n=1 Tax=Fasciolopsis buskii TaxID=27845 RepID=A0A8E0VCI6_9TREM|nr:hypothetical protein FBUS_00034 [Fasciolopsis buski]
MVVPNLHNWVVITAVCLVLRISPQLKPNRFSQRTASLVRTVVTLGVNRLVNLACAGSSAKTHETIVYNVRPESPLQMKCCFGEVTDITSLEWRKVNGQLPDKFIAEESTGILLKDARRDIGLVKLFPILCEIVEVHPITEEVVVKLSATSKHMRNTGYPNEDKTQQAKFFEGIFHRDYAATVNYYFTIYSSTYQTVFVEGRVYIEDQLVEYNDNLSGMDKLEFQELNDKVCKHLHKLRSLAETFAKVPMKCTAYTMDLDSMLVIQLSFLDRHLIEAGLSTNEVQLRSTVQGWLTQIPSTGSLIEFVPYVINPVLFAFGQASKSGQLVTNLPDPNDSKKFMLQDNIRDHIGVIRQSGKHSDYLLRECDVLSHDTENSVVTVAVKVARKTLTCSAADPEDLNIVWVDQSELSYLTQDNELNNLLMEFENS